MLGDVGRPKLANSTIRSKHFLMFSKKDRDAGLFRVISPVYSELLNPEYVSLS